MGQTPQLVLHPKHPGRSSSLTPQLLQDLTFLGYIQGVFSAQPHYVTLSTALEAVGPGERGKSKGGSAVGLWGACDHTDTAVATEGDGAKNVPRWGRPRGRVEEEGSDINLHSPPVRSHALFRLC